jgi:hypothetical protein
MQMEADGKRWRDRAELSKEVKRFLLLNVALPVSRAGRGRFHSLPNDMAHHRLIRLRFSILRLLPISLVILECAACAATGPDTPTVIVPSTGTTGSPVAMAVSAPASAGPLTWTFGDGTTAQTSTFNTTHTYTAAGFYTVNVAGNGGSTSGTIIISDPPPTLRPRRRRRSRSRCSARHSLRQR